MTIFIDNMGDRKGLIIARSIDQLLPLSKQCSIGLYILLSVQNISNFSARILLVMPWEKKGISQPEKHNQIFEMAIASPKRSLPFVSLGNAHSTETIQRFADQGQKNNHS